MRRVQFEKVRMFLFTVSLHSRGQRQKQSTGCFVGDLVTQKWKLQIAGAGFGSDALAESGH